MIRRTWYFCFSDTVNHWLARILCRPGYRHVSAFTEINGFIIAIDPLRAAVNQTFTNEYDAGMIAEIMKDQGYTVYQVDIDIDQGATVRRSWGVTCASYLAYTAGIPFSGVTPYQLYRKIAKMGAKLI